MSEVRSDEVKRSLGRNTPWRARAGKMPAHGRHRGTEVPAHGADGRKSERNLLQRLVTSWYNVPAHEPDGLDSVKAAPGEVTATLVAASMLRHLSAELGTAATVLRQLTAEAQTCVSLRVSVVVPTYRRPDLLDRCLEALVAQELAPDEYEIIVADDAWSDETGCQVAKWAERAGEQGVRIRYVRPEGKHGPAAARNAGWRAARGRVFAFTDDDCVPEPGWLRAGLDALTEGMAAISGRIVLPLPETPTDYELNAAHLAHAEFATANSFYRREALERAGGFDERFTAAWREDSDLQFALRQAGERLEHAPEAVVVHPIRPAPWGVSLRQQRKSQFNALLYKKHPDLYRQRIQSSPPWRYYAILGALVGVALSLGLGYPWLGVVFAAIWVVLTARFCAQRLARTSRAPGHVAEMVITSALIPPLAIVWRLYGAVKYRVWFL